MVSARVLSVLSVLSGAVLVFGLGLVTPGPAVADDSRLPQTLRFTSPVPTDAVADGRGAVAVTAESTSGLPVTISTDPDTPACSINPFPGPDLLYGNVEFDAPGTCTVFADQPGDDQYAPASRISMTFQIARDETVLLVKKASKGVLGLTPTTFRADLQYLGWFGPGQVLYPYVGQEVTFAVGGKTMCSATTVYQASAMFFGSAIATCKATIGLAAALKYSSYTASFAGTSDYLPASATGSLQ